MLIFLWRTITAVICTAFLHCAVFLLMPDLSLVSAVTVQAMKILRQYHVIPDVIDVAPTSVIQVRYPNHVIVKMGGELNMTDAAQKPLITWPAASDGYYTLIMTDPDSPTPLKPTNREFKHYMVVNIPGSKVGEGDVCAEYIGPINDHDRGIHRYVFVAFRQQDIHPFEEGFLTTEDIKQRANFSSLGFAKKHEFGYPVAVNFFRVDFKRDQDTDPRRRG